MQARVLVVDDEEDNRHLYSRFLSKEFEVEVAEGGAPALERLGEGDVEILVTDLRMPGMDGIELARRVREDHPHVEIVVVTGNADLDSAVEAHHLGVADFLVKPIRGATLRAAVARGLEKRRLLESLERIQRSIVAPGGLGGLLGESAAMQKVRAAVTRVQNTDTTVLIQGETGTGKELVARSLHEGGHRAGGPFVAVNCAAVAPELLESELFGHEAGAFTGAQKAKAGHLEEADGGTFFLDEVGELPLELQAKLLRVLQEKEITRLGSSKPRPVDFRLVAATNRDLATEVAAGKFRQDLFYRLNVYPVRTPALRDHPEDVPELCRAFAASQCRVFGRPVVEFSPELLDALKARTWEGNVRELQNLVERMILVTDGDVLDPGALDRATEMEGSSRPPPRSPNGDGALLPAGTDLETFPSLEDLERQYIERVLELTEGNKAAAARVLGIHPATLKRKL